MCAAARLGHDYWSYGLVLAILIPFYLGQLLEHNIGIVRTHVGGMGVTEGQDAQILALLILAFLGDSVLYFKISSIVPFFPDFLTI